MPRSSSASLSAETIQELETQFFEFLNSLSSDDRKKFFAEFLTNEEKMMMYKRLALYWCLLEGYSLAKIQQMIGVTHDTTRVYNKRKNTLSPEFKALVQKIGKNSDGVSEPNSQESYTSPASEPVEERHEEQMPAPEMVMEEPTVEPVITEPTEESPNVVITESTDEIQKMDMGVNLDPESPIETRPLDEPMNDLRMEQDKHEQEEEKPLQMDSMESMDSPAEVIAQDTQDPIRAEENTQSEGFSPNQEPNENKIRENDSDGDPDEGKKKSPLAKFFGF